ncbi:hypothetical protein IGI42_000949 [Enterococcus sp. AZ109]
MTVLLQRKNLKALIYQRFKVFVLLTHTAFHFELNQAIQFHGIFHR